MTPEVRRKVLVAIRAGNYREVAARAAGINPSTLRAYVKRKDEEAQEFLAAIHEAESDVEIELVGAVKRFAAGDMRAATWYLSHSSSGAVSMGHVSASRMIRTASARHFSN